MVSSARKTAVGKIEVVAYVDSDDAWSLASCNKLGIKYKVGVRQTLSNCWNELVPLAEGDIFMQANDDIVFRTKGWDRQVEEAFSNVDDKILMVHGSDMSPGSEEVGKKTFGPHPFVHRRWVETLGYFTPPYFSSDYGDTWINELANMIGRRRYLPFDVEHMHYVWGKAGMDETTTERLERHVADEVSKNYAELLPKRKADAEKLKDVINKRGKPIWTIMILTQPSRADFLNKLLEVLQPQLKGKKIELLIRQFDPNLSLGENRENMRKEAAGTYSCFVDDDDLVADTYVEKIFPFLEVGKVDYVGFQLQYYSNGTKEIPTYHSLRYSEWSSDQKGYYRDISHINPIRTALALKVSMEGGPGEDHRWAQAIAKTGLVKTEHYVDEVMYHYYFRSTKSDGAVTPVVKPAQIACSKCGLANDPIPYCIRCHAVLSRPAKVRPDNWRATYMQCPACRSTCVVKFSNGLRCNDCGNQFK